MTIESQQGWANVLVRGLHSETDLVRGPHKYLQREFVPQTYSKAKNHPHF